MPVELVEKARPMRVSQKCQYALRAVFELARRGEGGPVKISEIAGAQAIPPRFLEVILSQLKQGGFVESRRGAEGGYLLARPAHAITVGELIRFIDGPIGPVGCFEEDSTERCELRGQCVFSEMWKKAHEAVCGVYDSTTIHDLVEEDKYKGQVEAATYTI